MRLTWPFSGKQERGCKAHREEKNEGEEEEDGKREEAGTGKRGQDKKGPASSAGRTTLF